MTLDNKLPEKMSFTLTITYEDFIVRDHQLYGVRAVPGVSFIDFIYRFLIMRGCTPSHYEIRNLLFKQPVIPTADNDQKVKLLKYFNINDTIIEFKKSTKYNPDSIF